MANKKDYYEILGVNKNATEEEIKSAYRKQAKASHPDLHPNDKEAEARFKELNEAVGVLSDPKKRAQYDQFGHAAFDNAASGSYSGGNPFSGFGGFSDIFETMFGSGFGSATQQKNGPIQGNNLRYSLTISFEDAAFGAKREILVPREQNCATCNGTGAKPGTHPERCTACNGTGQVRVQQNTMLGSFTSVRPCTVCNGVGEVIKEPCLDCLGKGRIKKTSRVVLDIPAGIDDGQTIHLPWEGEAGYRSGPNGDLYVNITIKPHKLFRRNGYDLQLNISIPFTVAALGGEITVPTLRDSIKYMIPEGTQTGTTFRMRGQGIQRLRGRDKGDLLVKVDVEVPKRLNERQKEALRAYGEAMGEQRGELKQPKKGFFNSVKGAMNT
ncbi:MAG: molecular chaperone DnaJ [Clostridiales bacterium]|nr:molecular chaperone DnaJ [Clostridiales bacterium]